MIDRSFSLLTCSFLFFVFLLSSCKDGFVCNDASFNQLLIGTWTVDCEKNEEGQYNVSTEIIRADGTFAINGKVYQDNACTNLYMESAGTGTWKAFDARSENLSHGACGGKFDMTIDTVEFALGQDLFDQADPNGNAYCGATDWEAGELHDVAGCPFEGFGGVVFIDQGETMFGFRSVDPTLDDDFYYMYGDESSSPIDPIAEEDREDDVVDRPGTVLTRTAD